MKKVEDGMEKFEDGRRKLKIVLKNVEDGLEEG